MDRLETSESINANRQEMNTTAKSPARPSTCFKSRAPSKNLLPASCPEVLVRVMVVAEARKQDQVGERRVDARWNEGRAHILLATCRHRLVAATQASPPPRSPPRRNARNLRRRS